MPGSGKSTIGILLARKLNYDFIDTDIYIEQKEQRNLQDILDEDGVDYFCKIEQERILELLPVNNHVIAPGGSVIYSKKLIAALQEASFIIFLDVPLDILQNRLENKETRGIVRLKKKSLETLYQERVPLYKKYADLVISCNDHSPDEIIKVILPHMNF
jgi:shikimate kinase